MTSFVFLPPPLRCQLSNSQTAKRGHQIEFYSLLIEDGGPIERPATVGVVRSRDRPPDRPTIRPLDGHF